MAIWKRRTTKSEGMWFLNDSRVFTIIKGCLQMIDPVSNITALTIIINPIIQKLFPKPFLAESSTLNLQADYIFVECLLRGINSEIIGDLDNTDSSYECSLDDTLAMESLEIIGRYFRKNC